MSVEQATTADTSLAVAPAKRGETRILGPIAVGLALLSAFATFVVLADLTPISPTHYVVVTLLLANAATVLLLLGMIVREVWQVVQARRSGRAAARLHVRIVGLFSIIAAAPAISARTELLIDPFAFDVQELWLIPALILLAVVAGVLPGVRAYRADVAESLGE